MIQSNESWQTWNWWSDRSWIFAREEAGLWSANKYVPSYRWTWRWTCSCPSTVPSNCKRPISPSARRHSPFQQFHSGSEKQRRDSSSTQRNTLLKWFTMILIKGIGEKEGIRMNRVTNWSHSCLSSSFAFKCWSYYGVAGDVDVDEAVLGHGTSPGHVHPKRLLQGPILLAPLLHRWLKNHRNCLLQLRRNLQTLRVLKWKINPN